MSVSITKNKYEFRAYGVMCVIYNNYAHTWHLSLWCAQESSALNQKLPFFYVSDRLINRNTNQNLRLFKLSINMKHFFEVFFYIRIMRMLKITCDETNNLHLHRNTKKNVGPFRERLLSKVISEMSGKNLRQTDVQSEWLKSILMLSGHAYHAYITPWLDHSVFFFFAWRMFSIHTANCLCISITPWSYF